MKPEAPMQALRGEPAKRGWRCPDEQDIVRYADGSLAGRARERVEAHVSRCDVCLDAVAFLSRQRDAELPEVPAGLLLRAQELVPEPRPMTARLAWRWATLAATCAGLALVISWRLPPPEMQPAPPSPPEAPNAALAKAAPPKVPALSGVPREVRKAQRAANVPQLVFPRDGAVVPAHAVEFRWGGIRQSLSYEVRVATAAGDLVWEGRTPEKQARLPGDIHLAPGEKYFVWVLAHLPEGKTVRSKATAFRVESRD